MTLITKFRAGWNPHSNRGQILFQSSAGENRTLNFDNPAEFGAVLQILSTADKVGVDQNWTIWTGTEDVDGEDDGYLTQST